ncbi:MAG: sulfatase [Planctomycetota bacterium]
MIATVAACAKHAAPAERAASSPLVHLSDTLDPARAKSAPAPNHAREVRTWSFAEARDDWRIVAKATSPHLSALTLERVADATRLSLGSPEDASGGAMLAGLAIDLPPTRRDQWTAIVVRARSHDRLAGIGSAYNAATKTQVPRGFGFFMGAPGTSPVFNDGSVQSYFLPLVGHDDEMLDTVGFFVAAPKPARIDILSVALVPRGASYEDAFGVQALTRGTETRRTVFSHTPVTLTWPLHVPKGGRFDFALTSLLGEDVAYQVNVRAGQGEPTKLFDESVQNSDAWLQRGVDLARWSGQNVELELSASSTRAGSVALLGTPLVSGTVAARRPNVILYVIDGAGADLMSLYGYNRRTTPFLERLAAEGVVFERAYSNSTWTQSSTASFMTSLHHSVLGGLRRGIHSTPVPAAATTMAEHMRRGGYATAVFTTNPNCARVIGLERGVDFMSDGREEEGTTSAANLHDRFWRFRRDYPGRPYWIHFQTTDVHEPNESVAPFAGLYVSAAERAQLEQWDAQIWKTRGELFGKTSIAGFYDAALEKAGIDRHGYFNLRRGMHDETMAQQDHALAQFVGMLENTGEWENTILVIASDHGHPAGTFARWGRGLFDPQPEPWQGALFDAYATHIPLIVIAPKRFSGGRRIAQPVSMIDVLPTILDLAGLPAAEIAQGRSLAPLLHGKELAPRPVIFDEFRVDEAAGEMVGNLEMIDGRWGASLEIGPTLDDESSMGRHSVPAGGRWGAVHPYFPNVPRLLLYDLWKDPFALRAVNDEHPELVAHYERELLAHWSANRALALRFGEADEAQALSPEALKQLRDLGYVR